MGSSRLYSAFFPFFIFFLTLFWGYYCSCVFHLLMAYYLLFIFSLYDASFVFVIVVVTVLLTMLYWG